MEEKNREEAKRIRRDSNARPPITPLSGRGSGALSGPNPTQVPVDWPPHYPDHLRPETGVIFGEAVQKFPVRTQILELCKYVISELTPRFYAAVQNKTLRADLVVSTVSDLLSSLLICNYENSSERYRLNRELRKSDEWMKLAVEIAKIPIAVFTPHMPLSNPLTAEDAGSCATVRVESFVMAIPRRRNVQLDSGSICGLSYSTLYNIYFDDPNFHAEDTAGAIYHASVRKITAGCGGRFFVGSILTPAKGGPPTIGNADGGAAKPRQTRSTRPTETRCSENGEPSINKSRGVGKETAENKQFRITVEAAKQLFLCDIQEVAGRLAGTPISLLSRLFPDGSQQCIRDAFAQFLRIGKKFPNEIRRNPAKWARSMAAGVIIESVTSGPFEVCLPQLLSLLNGEEAKAILLEEAILEGVGHEGRVDATESAPPDADAVIGGHGTAQVVAENAVHLTSTVNKTAPTNTDSAESKSLEPSEGARADLEVAKDSTGIIGSKKKRGPQAKMQFHRAVAEVVHSFGPNWKEHLDQIAGKLDRRKIPALRAWAKRSRSAKSWMRAVEYYPAVVVKTLEYSLKMAAKDIIGKPSETLGNLR